ncbi:OsmC family protein [Variovorax soli]|uniref:OsmC family protein n=1 Tax=Variovorax soli TaxID=376815 RepID=UPI0008392FCC|nr:OsmC family protein [Variovorax soli]
MSIERIQQSLGKLSKHFEGQPQDALSKDAPATAVLESGLRCRVDGPGGVAVVTDMPVSIGGTNSAPSPGWLMRAALANCDATLVALRAAQLGIVLQHLEVTAESESDHRGILGLDEAVPAGPLDVRVTVRVAAEGVSEEQLRELVHWAEQHSPVGDALRRAVPLRVDVVTS